MPSRDFDAARRERDRTREPLTFTLGGQAFTCLAAPTVGDALDLADAPEHPHPGAIPALVTFIEHLLASDDDRARFQALLRRREDPIDHEAIIDVGAWLADQYVALPEEAPADADPSDASTGSSPSPATGGRSTKKRPEHRGRVTSSP